MEILVRGLFTLRLYCVLKETVLIQLTGALLQEGVKHFFLLN